LLHSRTQLTNAIRGFAMEFGIIAAKGMCKIEPLLEQIAADDKLPELARKLFAMHGEEYRELFSQFKAIDEKLMKLHRATVAHACPKSPASARLKRHFC
jgi:transposase